MANTSLPDLTERTATADSDLIHVHSGGSDYKQTKQNFLQGDLYHVFDNTSLLTTQIDALPNMGTFFGRIASYGAQSVTGIPINSNGDVFVQKFNGNYIVVDFHPVGNSDATYRKCKNGGTWESSWTQLPSRSEITALNNSLANSLKLGDWTANLTLPYTPTSDGFISVWLNPSSASGAYARLSVTGDSHAMGLNAKGGDGVTLVFPIKKNATVSQAALSNGTLSVRFISIFG